MGRDTFGRDVATLIGGTAMAQAIAVAAAPVLARQYSPASFGELAVFVAISGLVGTVVTLRYEMAIILPQREREARALFVLALVLAVGLGMLLGGVLMTLPSSFRAATGSGGLGWWLPATAVGGISVAFVAVGSAWLNRHRMYARMAFARVAQNIAVVALAVGLGMVGLHSGMLLAQLGGALLGAAVVMVFCQRVQSPSRDSLRSVARTHLSAPKLLLPTALLDVATTAMPVVLISAWFGVGSAGQYSLAWRVIAIPMTLVGVAVGQVFYQRFARAHARGFGADTLLWRTWGVLLAVGVLPAIALLVAGPQLFSWIFGERWESAGKIAAALAPMLLAMLVSSPTSSSFLVLGLQKTSLWFGLSTLIYRPTLLYVGVITDDLVLALALWSFFEIVQILLYNYIALGHLKREARESPRAMQRKGASSSESLHRAQED